MTTIDDWVEALELVPHIEGGYYRQIYKSKESARTDRALYTSIYFLLTAESPSRFHRLTADEIWYFHAGAPLTIHMIHPDGTYEAVKLSNKVLDNCRLQYCVPKGTIFGSTVEDEGAFALVSCMVAPGFEYEDFELFDRVKLLASYPDHADIITRLTKGE
ncbi:MULTISPECIES: cupin domain-containing protein [unclassified Streptococcus]|uniref:cupin domain-containing protein n=1 Tax=unclassified Streptococcus TaxID=2608887 RepID=UPI00359CCAA2